MKIENYEGSQERYVLIGMIADPLVLARVFPIWEKRLGSLHSKWANIIGSWCIEYFGMYGQPPGEVIKQIFANWAATGERDRDVCQMIERFLASLSDEFSRTDKNTQWMLDQTAECLERVKLQRLSDLIQATATSGDLSAVHKTLANWGRADLSGGDLGINPFADPLAVQAAFASRGKPLFTYPGALGEFFLDTFERDAFVSILAPEKRGKSQWLMDIAWRGMMAHKRVGFVIVGDMSQNQIMRRLMHRVAAQPKRPQTVRWPVDIARGPNLTDPAVVSFTDHYFQAGLNPDDAVAACQRLVREHLQSDVDSFRLLCRPARSVNVGQIKTIIDQWGHGGFVPDLLVIDYADVLAPPAGIQDPREQHNVTWQELRGLSQSLHCCLVTATQADADSYGRLTLGMKNFSEDKRKLSHVTGMFALNQTEDEKRDSVMRLNTIVLREEEFSVSRCVYVAGCIPLGCPAVLSCW